MTLRIRRNCLRLSGAGTIPSFLRAGMIATSVILLGAVPVAAQIRGEPDLLRQVAAQYRANRDAILTWQGEAEITYRIVGKLEGQPWDLTTVTKITFAYDRAAKKYMFLAEKDQEMGVKQGHQVKSPERTAWGGIRTAEGYYTVREWFVDGKQGQPKRPELQLEPHSAERPGDFSPHFDPFWYLEMSHLDVHDRLMFYFENAALESMSHVTVTRANHRVTFLAHKPEVGTNRYVFDLDQGGNPIEVGGGDATVTEDHSRSFELVSNVWVPKTASSKVTNSRTGIVHQCQVTWLKNAVNQSVPADVFSPERILIRQGDWVHDQRTGEQYRYDESVGVEGLGDKGPFSTPTIVVVAVVAAVGVVAVAWIVRRRLKKGSNHGCAA